MLFQNLGLALDTFDVRTLCHLYKYSYHTLTLKIYMTLNELRDKINLVKFKNKI